MGPKPRKIVPFLPKGGKPDTQDGILEQGTIGNLSYEVYKRGNIHIFDKARTTIFKKDCGLFEDALADAKIDKMSDGDSREIKGSGDNDTLVFKCVNGDIEWSLKKRSYPMLERLHGLLNKGKKSKNGTKD
jgi:hypothetical protein